MADDLHKRYVDRFFLALKEDYEVRDFEAKVKKERPNATSDQIHAALLSCAKTLPSNHPMQRIHDCVLTKV